MLPFTVQQNSQLLRFESKVGADVAFLDYRWYKGSLALMHTFVPLPARGQGLAAALAHFALEFAKTEGLSILVYCPYVSKYLRSHPAYQNLIDKRFTQR